MILSDREIVEYVSKDLLVTPSSEVFRNNLIGPSSVDLRICGKAIRLKNRRKVFDLANAEDFNRYFTWEDFEEIIVKPREHLLLSSIESLKIPLDVMGFVSLKSTYARLGLSIPPTIINAGSEGELTIELIGGPFPVKIRKGDRIVQIVFVKLTSPVQSPYRGKYQNQSGPTLPKL